MILFVFLICLIASTMGGICGIGGGVIIKPLLDAMGVMSVSAVSFLSGITVLTMAVISVYKNRHSNELDPGHSIPLGLGAAIGGIAGKQLFSMLKAAAGADNIVGATQAILLGLMVLSTLLYVHNRSRITPRQVSNPFVSAAIGFILGVLSSFLGIGGGPMNIAVLYYFFSMDTKRAAVNSILIILLSQIASLLMSLVTASVPTFQWPMLVAMATAGVLGGLISAQLHRKLSGSQVDQLFSGMLVVIFLICCYNTVQMLA